MSRLPCRLLALVPTLALALPALAQEDRALELGREQSEAFVAGDLDPIWDVMTEDMRAALGDLEGFTAFRDEVVGQWGQETDVLDETVESTPLGEVYTRVTLWENFQSPVVMEWAFDREERIAGFYVQPQAQAADSAFLDYETKSALRLPFDGEWHVFWGGRAIEDNYHAADPAQRFALDFVVRQDGATYAGDPGNLESYHCWGREILAPADGLVIATVNDLPDQAIGESDPDNPAGNHVILNLAEDEYAFLAHFQEGSIRVQMGSEVSQGDVLGLCGNSGNTSEPHLHFHLQTTPDLENGEGLPAQFLDYEVNGEAIERGEPERGQTVANR